MDKRNTGWARGLLGLMLLATTTGSSAALPPADSQGRELPTLAPMLETVMPAVVNIATLGHLRVRDNPLLRDPVFRYFFNIPEAPRADRPQSLGSGVIVDAERGYVLTNNHVIDKAEEIAVTLADGRRLQAALVGTDPEADIAVIKIPGEHLTALPFADSERLKVGDFVVAIGNPFGLGQTVTSGIVSALGRSGLGIEGYEDFIQTDASINPGNSGGALVDLRGALVGINTAIIAPNGGNIGIGFAIPANMARKIMAQLVEYGEVRRGRLGIAVQDLTPELARAFGAAGEISGAVVVQIAKDSPADQAGIESGDIVLRIDGRAVRDAADLRNAIGLLRVGEQVVLDLWREGRERRVTAVVAESEQARLMGERLNPRLTGAVFGEIEPGMPFYGRIEGAVVLEVSAGSPAQRAGLRPGDIVTSANRRAVASLKDLQEILGRGSGSVLLNLRRGAAALFVLLK